MVAGTWTDKERLNIYTYIPIPKTVEPHLTVHNVTARLKALRLEHGFCCDNRHFLVGWVVGLPVVGHLAHHHTLTNRHLHTNIRRG